MVEELTAVETAGEGLAVAFQTAEQTGWPGKGMKRWLAAECLKELACGCDLLLLLVDQRSLSEEW